MVLKKAVEWSKETLEAWWQPLKANSHKRYAKEVGSLYAPFNKD